jgi:hypothetical protein
MRVLIVVFALVAGLLAGCGEDEPKQYTEARPEKADAAVATRFAPLVFLAQGESNLPMDATNYARQSALFFANDARCEDAGVADRVEPRKLGKGPEVYKTGGCSLTDDSSMAVTDDPAKFPEHTGFYLRPADSTRSGEGAGAPVYWEYHEQDGKAAYVYWFFYGYNGAINEHEGDWERIAVQIQAGKPVAVTFFGHGRDPCVMPWQDQQLGKSGEHAQIYSAKGSHASYPTTANLSIDQRSAGTQWNTWERLRPTDQEPWFGYRGWWGEQSWAPASDGPIGPYPQRFLNVFTDKACDESKSAITTQLPQDFEGEWETRESEPATQQPAVTPYQMRVSLGKDKSTVHYRTTWTAPDAELECDGTWAVSAATDEYVELHEQIVTQSAGNCVTEGTVVLSKDGDALKVSYRSGSLRMTAKLYKRTKAADPPTVANTKAGAVQRYEQYLHALGNENIDTMCEIAAPAAKKAEQQGLGPCKQTFAMMLQMISPTQKSALKTATVDTSQVTEKPGTVEVPAKAVRAGTTKFTSSDLGDRTLTFMNGQWFITD